MRVTAPQPGARLGRCDEAAAARGQPWWSRIAGAGGRPCQDAWRRGSDGGVTLQGERQGEARFPVKRRAEAAAARSTLRRLRSLSWRMR
jgi:hypothetical protein